MSSRRGFGRRVRSYALASASVIPLLALGAGALAQPVGGNVVAGQAQIITAGATTLISQSTAKAIINWQEFSVAQGAAVQFNQPNAAAITLNRVTGGNVSAIDGAIRANGQVWLLNPNGLLIGNGAQINVGGLLATTSDIANQDFLAGRYNFSGGGSGAIVNNGTIHARPGGSVVLSAPKVTNTGVIAARAGHVVLAGTDTFTVDFDGDHLISYAVGASSQTGQVLNSGAIKAAGGNVLLTARAASGVQDGVVNNTGMVSATSAHSVNGEIVLDAGEGTAVNSGTLDASGTKAGQTGGTVQVLGAQVAVADGALIDASGDAGGGTVLIGGNFHGQGSQQHAQTTIVGKAAIKADAITSGNGGKVAVWSDGSTGFAGAISAQGGASGGNGGQVETSGHYLQVADGASVITAAPFGTVGNWLLDPDFLTITNSGSGSLSDSINGGVGIAFSTSFTSTVSPSTISAGLSNSDVTLQANNDITVMDSVIVNGTVGYAHTLTLQAGRSIIFNADAHITNLNPNGAVILSANDPGAEFPGGSGPNAVASGNSGRVAGTSGTPDAFITFNGTGSDSSYIIAAHVDLILHATDAAGVTDGGTIGTASLPAKTGPFSGLVGSPTYIQTDGLNAFVGTARNDGSTAATNVSFNFGFSDGFSNSLATGSLTNGVNLGTGSLTVIAAGATQSLPILTNSLTLLSSGSGAANSFNLNLANNNIPGFITINTDLPVTIGDSVTATLSTTLAQSLFVSDTAGVNLTGTIAATNGINIHAGTGINSIGGSLSGDSVDLRTTSGSIGGPPNGNVLVTANSFDAMTNGGAVSLTVNGRNVSTPSIGVAGVGISAAGAGVNITANSLSQTAPILSAALNINYTSGSTVGAYTLTDPGNRVTGTLIFQEPTNSTSTGAINFVNSQVLTVGSINTIPTNGSGSAYGSVTLQTLSGDLILSGAIQSNGLTLTASGNVSESSGTIHTAALTANANGPTGVINLANPLNVVTGAVTLNAVSVINFRNSVNTNLIRADYVPVLTAVPTNSVDIEVLGSGAPALILAGGQNGLVVAGNNVVLHAAGGIVQSGSGAVLGNTLTLVSDTGAIGTPTAPLLVLANNNILAGQAIGQIVLKLAPANGASTSAITFAQVGSFNGLNAGTSGVVDVFGTSVDVFAASIIANNFYFQTRSMQVDSLNAAQFGGQASGGTIDITGASGANLVIGNTISGVTSYGLDAGTGIIFLTADGTITQVAGGVGLIKSGTVGIFGQGGVTLANTGNAITGQIELASLANASLYNSIDTHLIAGFAAGTLTVQSAANLYLDTGATILSTLASGTSVVLVAQNGFINNAGIGGISTVTAAAVQASSGQGLPQGVFTEGGGRFLIYSASPGVDTLGGLVSGNPDIFSTTYPTAIAAGGNRFVFASVGTNTDTGTGLIPNTGNVAAVPTLSGFVTNITKPQNLPPPNPVLSPVDAIVLVPIILPPPPPPAAAGAIAALNGNSGPAEAPSSSDQATGYVATSLEGSTTPPVVIQGAAGGVLIPRFLRATAAVPPSTLTDTTALSGDGNTSLWQ